jgi:predicted 2-oxoglutarate/Fe(II)-dependent dioxygenase YbiX
MGISLRDKTLGIMKIAKPVGIVVAVQPYTNPTVTPLIRRTRILSASWRSNMIRSSDERKERPIHGWQSERVQLREVESKQEDAYEC